MEETFKKIEETLELVQVLKKNFKLKNNNQDKITLLYNGVAQSNIISKIIPHVEKYFGKAYKKAGDGAFMKNFFDGFVKEVGGIRKEQTLYKKEFTDNLKLYCAFWPWGSDPVRTSVRIGLLCEKYDNHDELVERLNHLFK